MKIPREMLEGLVDYAGLFPPAQLSLSAALAEYRRVRQGDLAWMLGCFVIPASRLTELAGDDLPGSVWPLSVLVTGPDDVDLIAQFASTSPNAVANMIEVRPERPEAIGSLSDLFARDLAVYFEIPADVDPAPWLREVLAVGRAAKIRTGGVTSEAIPSVEQVARFVWTCADLGVPFKATAGLHHPVRGEQPLTYDPDAPRGIMHGFLNVFTAAALAVVQRISISELSAVLSETDVGTFVWSDEGLQWRDYRLTPAQLAAMRAGFAHSFGSCSFAEPVEDLREAGLL